MILKWIVGHWDLQLRMGSLKQSIQGNGELKTLHHQMRMTYQAEIPEPTSVAFLQDHIFIAATEVTDHVILVEAPVAIARVRQLLSERAARDPLDSL